MDKRVIFVQKWLERAKAEEDEFDRFFAAWIALVVAAQRARDLEPPLTENETDRDKVLFYFERNRARVKHALEARAPEMTALAQRRGTSHGNPIVDTGNPELRHRFSRLARHYAGQETLGDDELVCTLAELLNRVRNNAFHGGKVYDDRDDIELLGLVNPVLMTVLEEAEK